MILMLIILVTSSSANVKIDFFEKLSKMGRGEVNDVVKKFPKRKLMKKNKTLSKSINYPKLEKAIKRVPEKVILANKAEAVINRGTFEATFFSGQKFNKQLALMVQSSKYGEKYFSMAKKVSAISPKTIVHNQYLSKQIPHNQLKSNILQSKYIDTLNKTGKWGWEKLQKIGLWITSHPKISGVSGAYAWYVLDPSGFEEQLKSSGKALTPFLMSTVGSVVGGVGEAVVEKGEEIKGEIKNDMNAFVDGKLEEMQMSSSYIITRLVGILSLILLFVAWRKRKIIRHFLLKAEDVKVENHKKEKTDYDDEF